MPMYEFRCESCGARFEGLVPAGTESIPCPECAVERTVRLFSGPVAPLRLVKGGAENRRQEARNAKLQADTRDRFKAARKKARETKSPGKSGPPAGAA